MRPLLQIRCRVKLHYKKSDPINHTIPICLNNRMMIQRPTYVVLPLKTLNHVPTTCPVGHHNLHRTGLISTLMRNFPDLCCLRLDDSMDQAILTP